MKQGFHQLSWTFSKNEKVRKPLHTGTRGARGAVWSTAGRAPALALLTVLRVPSLGEAPVLSAGQSPRGTLAEAAAPGAQLCSHPHLVAESQRLVPRSTGPYCWPTQPPEESLEDTTLAQRPC